MVFWVLWESAFPSLNQIKSTISEWMDRKSSFNCNCWWTGCCIIWLMVQFAQRNKSFLQGRRNPLYWVTFIFTQASREREREEERARNLCDEAKAVLFLKWRNIQNCTDYPGWNWDGPPVGRLFWKREREKEKNNAKRRQRFTWRRWEAQKKARHIFDSETSIVGYSFARRKREREKKRERHIA